MQGGAIKHKIFASEASKINTLAMIETLGNLKEWRGREWVSQKFFKKNEESLLRLQRQG